MILILDSVSGMPSSMMRVSVSGMPSSMMTSVASADDA